MGSMVDAEELSPMADSKCDAKFGPTPEVEFSPMADTECDPTVYANDSGSNPGRIRSSDNFEEKKCHSIALLSTL